MLEGQSEWKLLPEVIAFTEAETRHAQASRADLPVRNRAPKISKEESSAKTCKN